jgi:hypothetical protein
MKKTPTTLLACATFGAALHAQPIQEFMNFSMVGAFDADNKLELDAGDHTLDANTTSPGLFQSIYGEISGNSISRADFKAAVSTAYAQGLGGVITFEPGTFSYSGGDYIHPTAGTINRTGSNKIEAGGVVIERGPNWWFEGSAVTPYKGKHEAAFDGTGPSGPDRLNYDEIFFFTATGGAMGQTTSYDLVFNPADQISIVGFGLLNNYENFQAQQDISKQYAFYPNIHAIASFTNGLDTVTQMAVGLTSDTPGSNYYFGFAGPDGYFLDHLQVYAIGNNNRTFITIDELGFVQVPEPGTYAAVLGLLALAAVALRRRRAGK